jgi:hypothetical protein
MDPHTGVSSREVAAGIHDCFYVTAISCFRLERALSDRHMLDRHIDKLYNLLYFDCLSLRQSMLVPAPDAPIKVHS